MKILVVNGVNMNKLGSRESIYGSQTLDEINERIKRFISERDGAVDVEFFQSNVEGEIVNRIQNEDYSALIINAGAYTHYSYAIADALASCKAVKVEVHVTNILAREEFRQKSVLARHCDGAVTGFGADGYLLAAEYILWRIR